MSITDELREWWLHKFPVMDKKLHDDFTAIADRIDERHRRALEKVAAMVDGHDTGWAGWSGCRSCKAHKRGGVVECQAYANMFRLDALEKRVSTIERKLTHRGER